MAVNSLLHRSFLPLSPHCIRCTCFLFCTNMTASCTRHRCDPTPPHPTGAILFTVSPTRSADRSRAAAPRNSQHLLRGVAAGLTNALDRRLSSRPAHGIVKHDPSYAKANPPGPTSLHRIIRHTLQRPIIACEAQLKKRIFPTTRKSNMVERMPVAIHTLSQPGISENNTERAGH